MSDELNTRICPSCGANDLVEMEGGKVKCSYCRAVFEFKTLKTLNNQPGLNPCPICDSRNPYRKTFTCEKCGRSYICSTHTRHGVCSDCYYNARLKRHLKQDIAGYTKGSSAGFVIAAIMIAGTLAFIFIMSSC